jgi:hypothetical protein
MAWIVLLMPSLPGALGCGCRRARSVEIFQHRPPKHFGRQAGFPAGHSPTSLIARRRASAGGSLRRWTCSRGLRGRQSGNDRLIAVYAGDLPRHRVSCDRHARLVLFLGSSRTDGSPGFGRPLNPQARSSQRSTSG